MKAGICSESVFAGYVKMTSGSSFISTAANARSPWLPRIIGGVVHWLAFCYSASLAHEAEAKHFAVQQLVRRARICKAQPQPKLPRLTASTPLCSSETFAIALKHRRSLARLPQTDTMELSKSACASLSQNSMFELIAGMKWSIPGGYPALGVGPGILSMRTEIRDSQRKSCWGVC
ncbi:hypothetical protein BU23DRAFT_49109 [Bimuria novae-zelandiae CBS 107.79]|uniref:Uncharacterized protein n=1 Tax=Bimuria novae-zelandiae CBS 107.79 TaxID=1447943 RepID=A0A6A5UUX6_9PLEO|nr:hypothetical protein BU23DRAFT_49109 [Bimuria novae-zelandiae CBS 107.79]